MNEIKHSPSIISCKDKIIKYSSNSIIFFENGHVYKQYLIKDMRWLNEVVLVNYLNHDNIIKFNKCEIVNDYAIDVKNKEIILNKKEKMLRVTMDKYNATLNQLRNFSDYEIFMILNKLLLAVNYCISKSILHRDIKEKNIFINYTQYPNPKKNKRKKRIINTVVLADFNISSYKFHVNKLKKSNIMTITHRPPELFYDIYNKKNNAYDDRVDVWAFGIVLSFLITDHSFYSFLNESFLQIDNTIIYSALKLSIIMKHFLKLHSRKLKHLEFYKSIILKCMVPYETRSTFQEIYDIIRTYNMNLNYNLEFPVLTKVISPEVNNLYKTIQYTNWVKKLHDESQNHDIIMVEFYKILKKTKNNQIASHTFLLSLYILVSYILNDFRQTIEYYITLLKTIEPNIVVTKNIILIEIANIMKQCDFCLLY